MKLLVPVYDLDLVEKVQAAAAAGGHIAAILNPDSGPGRGSKAVSGWKTAARDLRAAGAQLLYYVDLVQWDGDQGISAPEDGREKSVATLQAEMDSYIDRYDPPVGWFFDDLWDVTPARVSRLNKAVTYKGGFTVANPGTSDPSTKDYLATGVNVLVTWEKRGYLASSPAGWEKNQGARVGAMALNEPDYEKSLALAQKRNVNLFYATSASDDAGSGGGNLGTWQKLPPYFKELSKAVSLVGESLSIAAAAKRRKRIASR